MNNRGYNNRSQSNYRGQMNYNNRGQQVRPNVNNRRQNFVPKCYNCGIEGHYANNCQINRVNNNRGNNN